MIDTQPIERRGKATLGELKRAGVPQNHAASPFLHCTNPLSSRIRCATWHQLLTAHMLSSMELIQKRAIHIILNVTRGICPNVLFVAELESLDTRRRPINDFSRFFFHLQTNLGLFVYHILSHLCNILLLSLGWDLGLPLLFQDPFTYQKVLFINRLWPTSLLINYPSVTLKQ